MNKSLSLLAASLLLTTGSVFAGGEHGAHGAKPATTTASATEMVDGEVRKVDMDAKKITVKHGEIKSLEMPGMTMVFQVKDPAMLSQVKAGDKIRFVAEKSGGAIVITQLQAAK
jgi:Cu(I)/Ag(I) efflux system protein CusF